MPDSHSGPDSTADSFLTPLAALAPLSSSSPRVNSSPAAPACSVPSVPEPSGSGTGSRAGPTEPAEKDALAYTPRPAHGPPACGITNAQLQRGLRSICTECKRAHSVTSNVSICPEGCPCPWACRPSAHPGWGWRWVGSTGGYWSRTAERRAHRRLCYMCRLAVTFGPAHPTCPPWFSCPWASPPIVKTPPDEIGSVHHVKWDAYVRVEDAKRAAAEAKLPPRRVQVSTWPDADGVRGLRWIDANKPQTPEW